MRRKIIETEGQRYLMNLVEHTFLKVVDYIITKSVIIFSIENDVKRAALHDTYNSIEKKWGCANLQNEEIITCEYDSIEEMPKYLECYCRYKGFYFFDLDGTPLIIRDNNELVRFEGWTKVCWNRFPIKRLNIGEKDGLQGIVTGKGNVLLPPLYSSINIKNDNVITIKKDDCQQCILWHSSLNKWIIMPPEYTFVDYHYYREIYILRKDGFAGAMNRDLETVIPFRFDSIPSLKAQLGRLEYIVVEKKAKKGLYDIQRKKQILQCEFDDIKEGYGIHEYGGNIIVVDNGRQGVFSIEEEKIVFPICISLDYSIYANSIGEDVVCCNKNYINYFINVDGQVLFQIRGNLRFTAAGGFHNGTVTIDFHNYSAIFDRKGNELKRSNYEQNRRTRPSLGDYKADSWDAMTDGQYGDYSGDADYDALGF